MNVRAFFYPLFALLCFGESRSWGFVDAYQQDQERLGGTDSGGYFYTRDHLGSIRELTDDTAAIRARYDYDPYGIREKLSGDLDCDFAFTGHFYHTPTGLHLALYRAYDSETARWLSTDRFGSTTSRLNALLFETASRTYYLAGLTDPEELPFGPNLYAYLGQNPTNFTDPEGEVAPLVVIGIGILGGLALDYAIDKIKNRNLDEPESCPARTGANAGLGAATAATLKTQTKPRTGVAGGGRAGDGTSVASQLNHNLARNGAHSIPTRNLLSKCLRKVPYAGAALGAWQLGDAILNPAESE